MNLESFLGAVGIHKSNSDKIHDFLEKTTGITFSPLPHLEISDAPAWVDDVLSRVNEHSRKVIANAVEKNVAVAIALGDKILTNAFETKREHEYKTTELILLGNADKLIDRVGIPILPNEISAWQKQIVDGFKEKYTGRYTRERKWSSGAHTAVAMRLLEIGSQK